MAFGTSSFGFAPGPGAGPAAAFLRDPVATGRALRRWAWPLKAGLVSAALVAAIPLVLTAVVALGTGLLVFGVCRLVVIAGDALGLDPVGGSAKGVAASTSRPVQRSNVRVVAMERNA